MNMFYFVMIVSSSLVNYEADGPVVVWKADTELDL